MAYQSPGIQPVRRMPSFAGGYATGSAAEGADLWRGLTAAFAPFLGHSRDPGKFLFGTGIRPGGQSFTGGRPVDSVWGGGWEFTSTSDTIVICPTPDAFPITNAGGAQSTALIGYRKTDATARQTYYWRAGGPSGTGYGLQFNLGGNALVSTSGGANDAFVPAAGYKQTDFHVVAARRPFAVTDYNLHIDGQPAAVGSVHGADTFAGSLTLGNNAFNSGDLFVVGFFYLWNRKLTDRQIADISADPGILFRPQGRFYPAMRPPIDINLAADLTGGAVVSAGLSNVKTLGAALSGGATVGASMGVEVTFSAHIAANAQVTAALTGPVPLGGGRSLGTLGGAGAEAAGDPMGAGGPLHVLRALAVAGQVVRVTFDEMPLAQSAAGVNDALNPANYSFLVTQGSGTAPQAIGVDPNAIVGPARGVRGPVAVIGATFTTPIVITTATPHGSLTGDSVEVTGVLGNTNANGRWTVTATTEVTFELDGSVGNAPYAGGGVVQSDERAVDIHVDRQLIIGLTYSVTAHGIQSAFGGGLGFPYSAGFVGNVPLRQLSIPAVRSSFIDFDNPLSEGRWRIDDSGDLAVAGGAASLKKRIQRRLMTPKSAFRFLPGYGLALQLKETASLAQVAALKLDAKQQIAQEPEVAAVAIQATIAGNGVLTLLASVRTKVGVVVEAGVQVAPNGAISLI